MKGILKVGNASAFWGDEPDAPSRLVAQQPDLDFLTLDYLAEVSLSIMAIQKEKDSKAGYAKDFILAIQSLIPAWKQGSKVKIVTNAGGLNASSCAELAAMEIRKAGLKLKVAALTGDNVLQRLQQDPENPLFSNLETQAPLSKIAKNLVAANAYIGAEKISQALREGADIVIGGRIADPSLTVAPCMACFDWKADDYDKIAGATVAGHLIECGTQATGGISTDWLNLTGLAAIGFPVAEIHSDGSCIITKPKRSGGRVWERSVKEQLVYEIGDPSCYLSPDAIVSFLSLRVRDLNDDRVLVSEAKGSPPPGTLKVSAAYREGFKAEAFLTLFGRNAITKAKLAGKVVLDKLRQGGFELERSKIECLGAGDLVPGIFSQPDALECVLRIAVADSRYEAVERFSKEIAPLVSSGPQGITGYSSGRPKIRPVFGYWPCLINREELAIQIHYY